MREIERWCGVECTVNRVGDRYNDQLHRSGHHGRIEDLDRIAALGFNAIRYPVLWERVSPHSPDQADWSWCDERLARLDQLGLRVIAGLVHHGSGPHYTHLLDDGFAPGLARHAAAAAARYPWVSDWTPVNEPVTTARFAALYGHWYPHKRDEASFWRALVNQVDATRLSMRAIRSVTPGARLIQTDDLGRTWATTPLAEQAAFDNQRRWAGWDLLCGRVVAGHPLWHRLCALGLGERLRIIADDPCPPDIIGINHYPTSDRFLDHRVQLYPEDAKGANGVQAFADVPAVRTLDPAPEPFAAALREAWSRYTLPLALTEVHLGCTREEQIRWAQAAWRAACDAQGAGVDMRAVTAWSVLGSHDWDTLVTGEGRYEPGLFDLGSGSARITGLAQHWQALAAGGAHELAAQPGWWQRADRLIFARAPRTAGAITYRELRPAVPRLLLIRDDGGPLAPALAGACAARGIGCHVFDSGEIDLGDPATIEQLLDRHHPWALIDAAGCDTKGQGGGEADLAGAIAGRARLAAACAAREIPLVAISSDRVFGAPRDRPCVEDDEPTPSDATGRGLLALEQALLRHGYRPLLIRTSAPFGPDDPQGFAQAAASTLSAGMPFHAPDDHYVSPSYIPALAEAILDLAIDGETGVRHLAHDANLSWADFARLIATAIGRDPRLVAGVPAAQLGPDLPQTGSGLASRHLAPLGPLADAVRDFAARRRVDAPMVQVPPQAAERV